MRYWVFPVLAALCLLATPSGPASAADDDFYQGRTVTVYVGRSPGTGADLSVRIFTRFWQRNTPGAPTMIVKNIPGGGGKRVWNYGWERARPDGFNILFSPIAGISAIIKQEGLRADFSKLRLIGALMNPNIMYVRTGKVQTAADILTARGLIFGGHYAAHRFDIIGRLALDMLGVDYKYVTGFRGGTDVINAVRRGEVDIQFAALSFYRNSVERTMVADGAAVPLWHNPGADADGNLVALEVAGAMPDFVTFYTGLKGEPPSGRKFEIYKWLVSNVNRIAYAAFLPPAAADAPLEILRQSFAAVTRDEAYRTEERKLFGYNLPAIDPATGTRLIADFANAPDDVRAFIENYIKTGR